METITVELKHAKALQLLQDLEELEIIRINKEQPINSTPLSKYRGVLSKEEGKDLEAHIKEMRNEWNSI